MRRWLPGMVALAVVVAACGGGEESQAGDYADDLLQAMADGDNGHWRELTASDAVSIFPDGTELAMFDAVPWMDDDFDGDGVTSYADDVQFRNAMHGPARQHMEWECETSSDSEATCVVSATDAFIEAYGGDPMVTELTYSFVDGKMTREVGVVMNDSGEAWRAGMAQYQRWVDQAHPDVFDQLFRGSCCEAGLVETEAAIELHQDLLDEFIDGDG